MVWLVDEVRARDPRPGAVARVATLAAMAALATSFAVSAWAGPRVHCEVRYASQTWQVTAQPTADPLGVPSVTLNKRFAFKAVARGEGERIDQVSLYAYDLEAEGAPALIHQQRLSPPFASGTQVPALTGWQHVYSSVLGRELVYGCALRSGDAPPPEPLDAAPDAPPAPPAPVGPAVKLAFVGDVMLADGPGRVIAQGRDPFAHVAQRLRQADVRIANLECVVATRGRALDKPWTFRAHPRVLPVLQRHVDVVSLANNHSGDFGREAFTEMLGLLERAGLPQFGGGRNLREAHRAHLIERHGVKIALLAYNGFFPRHFEAGADHAGVAWSEEEQVLDGIRRARRELGADVVIPFMHWGTEGEGRANAHQRELARRMIEAGADAVVGAHPHVVQDTEVHRGKPIVYSLGNFVFDGFDSLDTRTGWMLFMTVGREGVRQWHVEPVRTDVEGTPHPLPVPSPAGG